MRYAVFSDIHSNLEAFEAILCILAKSRIDKYIFLGDIVGYGANPSECISHLRRLEPLIVAGNHDQGVSGLTNIEFFNEAAIAAILWTRDKITDGDRDYLSGLKLVEESCGFSLVHGTLSHPEEFDYMTEGHMALKTFHSMNNNICFVGHSHKPGVFIYDGHKSDYQVCGSIDIKAGLKYIINDGSVGQPRDGDRRACFCIYDDSARVIEFQRVEYDIAKAQKKIIGSGLPHILADRLAVGR